MTSSQAGLRGRLRIDVTASLAMLIIIPALPGFHPQYRDIQIDLGITDRPVDLITENVDCVVRAGELTEQSLIARRVGEMHFVTWAAPAYLARYGEPRHPSDLEKHHHVVSYFSSWTGHTFPQRYSSQDEQIELRSRYVIAVMRHPLSVLHPAQRCRSKHNLIYDRMEHESSRLSIRPQLDEEAAECRKWCNSSRSFAIGLTRLPTPSRNWCRRYGRP